MNRLMANNPRGFTFGSITHVPSEVRRCTPCTPRQAKSKAWFLCKGCPLEPQPFDVKL